MFNASAPRTDTPTAVTGFEAFRLRKAAREMRHVACIQADHAERLMHMADRLDWLADECEAR